MTDPQFNQNKTKFSKRQSILEVLSNNNIPEKLINEQENFLPQNLRRKHSMLNDVALKYRFELHEIQKITEEAGYGKKNDNLFRRVSVVGRVIDPDIKYGMKLLQEKRITNQNGIVDLEDEKQEVSRQYDLPSLNTDKFNYKSDINKYSLAPRGKDQGIFDISDISEISNESFQESSFSEPEEKLNKKKKIELKLASHNKRFSVFYKANSEDDTKEHLKLRKESLEKRKKEIGKVETSNRRVSILKDIPEIIRLKEMNNKTIIQNNPNYEQQYEKIYFGSGKYELIKNYLINPNDKIIHQTIIPPSEIVKEEISPRAKFLSIIENKYDKKELPGNVNTSILATNENLKNTGTLENCEISNRNKKPSILNSSFNTLAKSPNLSYRFSLKDIFPNENNDKKVDLRRAKKEDGFKMALIRSKNGEIIYTMVRNKNKNDKTRRNAVQNFDQRTTEKVDKAMGKLPLVSESQRLDDIERKELQRIKDLNSKRIEDSKKQKHVDFGLEVEINKQKLKTIGEKMNKILFDASKIYDKIEKKVKKNIEKKYKNAEEFTL